MNLKVLGKLFSNAQKSQGLLKPARVKESVGFSAGLELRDRDAGQARLSLLVGRQGDSETWGPQRHL